MMNDIDARIREISQIEDALELELTVAAWISQIKDAALTERFGLE